ncbi:MAG TPA: LysM peptidoglycan-binding domain-containing protein [Longimicrobiales bacterium]|nr:LysM peptidoglycan-binding domain-containing protein [Longimicrobiales bacterium]
MNERRYTKTMLMGAALLVVSLSAAWSVSRVEAPIEAAPMEQIVRETAAAEETKGVEWDLPVTRNESVDWWIDFLKGRNRDNTKKWLERTGKYGPMIQAELRRRGMPEDLLYLAMIESGLSPKAYSHAAASGMWQFIAETGQRYGLEVSRDVDERRDPIEATSAALDYLQDLYGRFGSWYLAAAAYNTGENRVERILRERAGGAKGADSLFWTIAPHLPRETRDYVPLMLAAAHIGKEPAKYGFTDLDYQQELEFDVVWVPGSTDLTMIAEASGVAVEDIEALNTHLTNGHTPANRGWSVRIPADTRVAFDRSFPKLYRTERLARTEDQTSAGSHRIARGETLSHVAKRYGVSVSALRSVNRNLDPRRLRVGQVVRVPGASAVASASADRYHRVSRGENLTVIARRYGVTVRQIRSWNDIRGSRILPGQRLRVST